MSINKELSEIVENRVQTGDRQILRTVRQWCTAEGRFKAFYFRSEVCRGTEVPVYAVLGLPKGQGPFPGVLHYHGGGQTADPYLVEALVRHGYAAISFDWTGSREDREHFTHWNGAKAVGYAATKADESYLIRALAAGRQCLSLLAENPKVAPERLGEFGISWGGFQTWLLNAVDDRLKAAIAIYGCGITRNQVRCYFQGEIQGLGNFDEERWFDLFHPANYAHDQKAPVLFVNGTNDFFGWMNNYRLLAKKLDSRHRCVFAPHINHGIATLNPTILAWLGHHLRNEAFPEAPELKIEQQAKYLMLRSAKLPGAVKAGFYLAEETGVGPDNFWHPYEADIKDGQYQVKIPLRKFSTSRLMVYGHQVLANGIELSSVPIRYGLESETIVKAPSDVKKVDFPLDPKFWCGPSPVDPFHPYQPLEGDVVSGLVSETTQNGGLVFQFNTRLVADSCYRPKPGQRLYARFKGPVQDPVTVAVVLYAGSPREQRYQGDFSLTDLSAGVKIDELKDTSGRKMKNTAGLSHLYLGGKTLQPARVYLIGAGWKK